MSAPTFLARTPTDLVALVPLVLGFHPRDSVVLLTFGSPGRSFHARIDLPTRGAEQDEVASVLLEAVRANEAGRVAVLLYTADAGLAESQARRLLEGLLDAPCEVLEVLRVADGEWFTLPEDGASGTSYDLETHPFTAQGVYAGQRVHRDREELVASVAALPPEQREEVAEAAVRAELDLEDESVPLHEHARWLQQCVRRHLGGAPPGPEDAGRMLVLASVIETRDVAWAEITRETAADHVELWRHLLRHAPHALVPGPAALTAFAAWQQGHGALAWCALDRCAEVDPDYSLARLLGDLLTGAVSPTVWRPMQEHDLPVFQGLAG